MNILKRFSLKQKNVLINSPESVYGFEIASGLCEAGANVWLCAESKEVLNDCCVRLSAQGAAPKGVIEYRQGSEESAIRLAKEAKEKLGSVDVLIDNSANVRLKGWVQDFDAIYNDLCRAQLGLMLTVKHIGLLMAEQRFGSVIFITDYAALVGCDPWNYLEDPEKFNEDFSLDYGFVKGSLVNYARQAAGFLGAHNVRCNCIAYAPVREGNPEGFCEAFVRHSHIKRMADPMDIKTAAIFLSSDASCYITGITLPVDGGYTAK